MRQFLAVILVVAACAVNASAALPTTVSYQGLVKSPGGGVVIDVTTSIRFTLYDQPTGGAQLWTETQSVVIDEGLFTVALGSIAPFGDIWSADAAYYLETEILGPGGFEIMQPRQRLISVPFALEASSLHGDVETEPAALEIRFGAGIPTTSIGSVDLRSSSDGTGLTFMDSSKATGAVARGIVKGVGGGMGGASMSLESDIDGDVSGFEVQTAVDDGLASQGQSPSSIESRTILKSYFAPGATPSSSQFSSVVDASGATLSLHAADLNRDGQSDVRCTPDSVTEVTEVTDGSSSSSSSMRNRLNALEEKLQNIGILARSTITSTCGDGATITVEDSSHTTGMLAKGTIKGGGMGTGGASMSFETNLAGDVAGFEVQTAEDDGLPGQGSSSMPLLPRSVLKSFYQKGDAPTQSQFSTMMDSRGASVSVHAADLNRDGFSDLQCTPDSVSEVTEVTDGSSSSSSNMRLRLNEIEAKLQNIGLLARTASTTSCGDGVSMEFVDSVYSTGARAKGIIAVKSGSGSGSLHRLSNDSDGDGVDDGSAEMSAQPFRTYLKLARDASPDRTIVIESDSSGPHVTLGDAGSDGYIELTNVPGSGTASPPYSVFRMGRPGVNNVLTTATEHGARMSTQSPSGSAHVQCWDGSCRMLLVDATQGLEDTSIVIDGTLKRFGIGVTEPLHPLHHSSGAHLSAAGSWTNASDVNLKENFKSVDGEELLDKVEALNITQWNYKNESDDVKHIGPTAQDFKRIFGVGVNDQTISTIDPSGIALAAIQELTRQNRELYTQNRDLASELAELKRRMDKLQAR